MEQDFELTEYLCGQQYLNHFCFQDKLKESPTTPSMEMPVKAGADVNSLNVTDQSTTRQWTANSWKSDYPLAQHLKP